MGEEGTRMPLGPYWTDPWRRRPGGWWRMQKRFSPEPLRVQVGMLLSGCGHYDGTDVQEAVLCGLALDRAGARVVALAPRREQLHTVDHTLGDEMESPPRDIYRES